MTAAVAVLQNLEGGEASKTTQYGNNSNDNDGYNSG
jgi:hypothetical protein